MTFLAPNRISAVGWIAQPQRPRWVTHKSDKMKNTQLQLLDIQPTLGTSQWVSIKHPKHPLPLSLSPILEPKLK